MRFMLHPSAWLVVESGRAALSLAFRRGRQRKMECSQGRRCNRTGVAGGTLAVQMIKQVVTTLKMTSLVESVSIPFYAQFMDDEGEFQPNEIMEKSADTMLAELRRVEGAIRPLRSAAS